MDMKKWWSKWIWKLDKPKSYGPYKNVQEMMDRDRSEYEAWFEDKFTSLYYTLQRYWEMPGNWCDNVKWGWQRARRGWSVRDTWSVDWYLTEIIPPMLKYLKEHKHGIPNQAFRPSDPVGKYGGHTDAAFKKAEKRWNKELDKMIYTFETARNMTEHSWFYQPSDKWSKREFDKYNKMWLDWKHEPAPRAMTKSECRRYEEGWKSFQENFFSLWD